MARHTETFEVEGGSRTYRCIRHISGDRQFEQIVKVEGFGSKPESPGVAI